MLATDILEGDSRVETANCTRCNSQLLVICSNIHLPKEKLTDFGGPKLLSCDREILEDVCKIPSALVFN